MSFVCLAGLPRSGSTLLSAILDQNPEIHAEGNSALVQLMWDLWVSAEQNASEQLQANHRTADDMIRALPAIYYKNINAQHIVDKCRTWVLPANMELLRRFITDKPRVIVLTRPIEQIVASFVRVRKENGWQGDLEADLWQPNSEVLMRPLAGVEWAKANNNGEFLFITYDELVDDTPDVLASIYRFCDFDPFDHSLTNIVNNHQEDDSIYNMIGLHDVRPTISRRAPLISSAGEA